MSGEELAGSEGPARGAAGAAPTTESMQASLNAKIFNLFALNKAAQILSSVLNLASLTRMAVDIAMELGGAMNSALYITDAEGEPFRLAAAKSLTGWSPPLVLETDLALGRTTEDHESRPFAGAVPGAERDGLVVPVRMREVRLGFFVLLDRVRSEPWSPDDLEVLSTLAAQVGVCVQNARLYQKVTEQYEALELAQSRRVQAEKVATMGMLLAGVAHELNNPLAVVIGHTAMLRQSAENAAQRARAERIAKAAERCARIIKNFLALAREHPPERQSVSLNQILREAVELLAYQLRVDEIEVVTDLADDLPALWADPHQLHQVIVNLVSNAHQAMRQSGPLRRLTLASRFDPDRAKVRAQVADTGPGVPAEIRSRIFDPFFTTKPTGQGTGLGLSLCQGIVEGHGGAIRLEDSGGPGAVFMIELPVQEAPATAREESGSDAQTVGGRSILVVDDEPDVLEVLSDILASDGHEVETASNGARALERLRDRPFDLVLSDMRMPELDGPGLYRELERMSPGPIRQFIFMTGDALGTGPREFIERVGAFSVSKPFDVEEVRRVIRRALAYPRGAA